MGKTYAMVDKEGYNVAMALFKTMVDKLPNYDDYTLEDITMFFAHLRNTPVSLSNDNVEDLNMNDVLEEIPMGD